MSEGMNKNQRDSYLICVDSDGSAVDSMTIKHVQAFGPAFIETFLIEERKDDILQEWNRLNLYSMERGLNRFEGLSKIVDYTNQNVQPIEGAHRLIEAVQNAEELNVQLFEKLYAAEDELIFKQAIDYSARVNQRIRAIPIADIVAFDYVEETLRKAAEFADIVVVSSANKKAVEEEWRRLGIAAYIQEVFTQEDGTKAQVIARLIKEKGYALDHVLKIGDAKGDFEAAQHNQVAFYPILVNQESQSWRALHDTYLYQFQSGSFGKEQEQLNHAFIMNLTREDEKEE